MIRLPFCLRAEKRRLFVKESSEQIRMGSFPGGKDSLTLQKYALNLCSDEMGKKNRENGRRLNE